jgi:YidC/Oxa1 family membrane protein insertase
LEIIGQIWNLIILQPLTNVLIALSHYLGNSFGLSIIVLTIAINAITYPLTVKQLRATKAMQDLQPKLAELQKKHGKDQQRLAQEQMKLYRESGMNPAGCLTATFLPMPIWIALYQTIRGVMATSPESFLGLSNNLYSWPVVFAAIPLNVHFLWLNLGAPDYLLAILVGISMWLQQKMTAQPTSDPKAAQQAQLMQVMMPIMFGFFSISVPSGLAIYWVVNAIIRIVIQYFFSGWGGLGGLPKQILAVIPFVKNQASLVSRKPNK